ncbi:hypothetical protein GCM10020221_31740 [Streptomyces thioluteus]|uniref:Uncharacterized protein n=1 Tax=Streptomyces thioluteus TaxID=66431 RepID=A0ABN3X2E2_STRTU
MRRSAPSVEAVLAPILRVLDDPPGAALSAFVRGAPLDVDGSAFAVEDARRLERRTAGLLRGLTP